MKELLFALDNTLPVFAIIIMGYYLRKKSVVDDNFISTSSFIVFNISLPLLIFLQVSAIEFEQMRVTHFLGFGAVATLTAFVMAWVAAIFLTREGRDIGVVIQGSFRSNFAIIGLALTANLYGEEGLTKASVMLAFIVPFYNFLSVIALSIPLKRRGSLRLFPIIKDIFRNPLIIAVLIAALYSLLKLPHWSTFTKTASYFAALTLPLALIGIGGSLQLTGITNLRLVTVASFLKIALFPALFTTAAAVYGLRGSELGIIFILFASPTAVASFVMADAMGANSRLAGSIIVVTTIFSAFTVALGIFLLRMLNLA